MDIAQEWSQSVGLLPMGQVDMLHLTFALFGIGLALFSKVTVYNTRV